MTARRLVVGKPMRSHVVAYGLDGVGPMAAPIEHAYCEASGDVASWHRPVKSVKEDSSGAVP